MKNKVDMVSVCDEAEEELIHQTLFCALLKCYKEVGIVRFKKFFTKQLLELCGWEDSKILKHKDHILRFCGDIAYEIYDYFKFKSSTYRLEFDVLSGQFWLNDTVSRKMSNHELAIHVEVIRSRLFEDIMDAEVIGKRKKNVKTKV